MAQTPHLDDRYTTGVWYDTRTGEYCEIIELDDTIGLCDPDCYEPYYLFSEDGLEKQDAIDTINTDMSAVSTEAVENPVETVTNALNMLTRRHKQQISSFSWSDAVDLTYACQQIEIQE